MARPGLPQSKRVRQYTCVGHSVGSRTWRWIFGLASTEVSGHVSDVYVLKTLFSVHSIHGTFSSVFKMCLGNALTPSIVNTHISVLWLGFKQPLMQLYLAQCMIQNSFVFEAGAGRAV